MPDTVAFTIRLSIGSFDGEPAKPSEADCAEMARSIHHVVEHYRAVEGLTEADSSIYVETVRDVSPAPDLARQP